MTVIDPQAPKPLSLQLGFPIRFLGHGLMIRGGYNMTSIFASDMTA